MAAGAAVGAAEPAAAGEEAAALQHGCAAATERRGRPAEPGEPALRGRAVSLPITPCAPALWEPSLSGGRVRAGRVC